MCEFRKLKASELQCKTTDTKFKGSATILIYKDARVDMKVLDETVTPLRWQKDYKEIDGKVYCGVAIKDAETGEWVWKWDCGTEGNFEAEKSEASDAFKRACFNFGIGRELYDTPKIKIKCPNDYYYNDKLTMTFSVKTIEWDDNTLTDLVIVDKFGKVVYDYKGGEQPQQTEEKEFKIPNRDLLVSFCKREKESGGDKDELARFYRFYSEKVDEWQGEFSPERLYKNWLSKKK